MKIALLLRGHVRDSFHNDNLLGFVKKLSSKYDLDLYIHTWNESEAKLSWRTLGSPKPVGDIQVLRYFRDVSVRNIIVDEDTKLDVHLKGKLDGHIGRMPRLAWKRMWFGIQKGMSAIINSKVKYDAVINTRFDIMTFSNFNGVDKELWSKENLIKVIDDFFDGKKDIKFVYDNEHICIDNFYVAKLNFMIDLIYKFNNDLDSFDFFVANYDYGHEKLVFKVAQMMQKSNSNYDMAAEYFLFKWSDKKLPNKDMLEDYISICKDLMFESESCVKKCIDLLKKNIILWAKHNFDKDSGEKIFSKEDLERSDWHIESIVGESFETQTSGSTTGYPFKYRRWQKFFDKLEWDNHYNLVLDEFNICQKPEILYFFSNHYKTKEKDLIFRDGASELSMNNHGNNRSPNVHYVNYEMYKENQEEFFKYLFDYVKENPIDVFFTASPQINSMCHYIRKFDIRHKIGHLLSQTNEFLLQEDARFLFIENNYFDHICDHMRCWDGGASFFTCKFGNYHLMDNLSWCDDVDGKLVCTDYFSFPSPFVNYWNGDMCKIEKEYKRCECGRLYREFEFLENRPFSLKGMCMRDVKEKIKSLNIDGIKQVRCSSSFLDIVTNRELTDEEKTDVSSVTDKFAFRFQVEDNKPYKIMFKDYETYKDNQIKKNKEKLDKIYVSEIEILSICEDLRSRMKPNQGLCHGVRNGYEVMMFRKHLGCTVLGTDISDTAKNFPYVMVHDFHKMRPEWKDKFDFIYSNSLDHSYDPVLALEVWSSCLKAGGLLYLEHTDDHNGNLDFADCFSANFEQYKKLVQEKLEIVKVINLGDYSNESLGYLIQNIKVIVGRRSF